MCTSFYPIKVYLLLLSKPLLETQPSIILAFALATQRAPFGTSTVTVLPAAIYAPASTVTGEIIFALQPIKAPFSMIEHWVFNEIYTSLFVGSVGRFGQLCFGAENT